MALNIIQGSDREFNVRIESQETKEPFDLTGVSEIVACFIKDDGSILSKKMTLGQIAVVNALGGKIKVTLDEVDTAALKAGENKSFEIEITIGTITSIVQFIEQLTVIKRVCVAA